MGTTLSVDRTGSIEIRNEQNGSVHRRVLHPGRLNAAAAWVDTPLAAEPADVRSLALLTWTPVVTQSYEATLRANLPPPLTVAEQAALALMAARRPNVPFDAAVTIGSVNGAAFTEKTFTVPGLLTTDIVVSAYFPAGLNPTTIAMTPIRISAANTIICHFAKIATGAVTPPTPQTLRVVVAR